MLDLLRRAVLGADVPITVTLASGVAVRAGDLLGFSAGWRLADADGGVVAQLIAGEDGINRITAYRAARVRGFGSGVAGAPLFLSNTAGGYSNVASAVSEQRVGILITADEALVDLHRFEEKFTVSHSFAAAGVAEIFFVAPIQVRVTRISQVHAAAASGACMLTVERLAATEVPGAGTDLLGATKINGQGAVNTTQSPALVGTPASLLLAVGSRLALRLTSGAATGLANACVTVELERA